MIVECKPRGFHSITITLEEEMELLVIVEALGYYHVDKDKIAIARSLCKQLAAFVPKDG